MTSRPYSERLDIDREMEKVIYAMHDGRYDLAREHEANICREVKSLVEQLEAAQQERKLLERRVTQQRKELARWEEPHHGSSWYVQVKELKEQLEAANERLAQYEEPGYITAVQKVQQLKEQNETLAKERSAAVDAANHWKWQADQARIGSEAKDGGLFDARRLLDETHAENARLIEQLEAVRTWFRTEPWKGHPDGSSFGCGDYTQAERAMGYGSYRDPRFLPAFLRDASTPAKTLTEAARGSGLTSGNQNPASAPLTEAARGSGLTSGNQNQDRGQDSA